MDKSDDLVKVLGELTIVQRNIANLQVELQGRKVISRYPVARLYVFTPIPRFQKVSLMTLILCCWILCHVSSASFVMISILCATELSHLATHETFLLVRDDT
jgi:hypothetical protein